MKQKLKLIFVGLMFILGLVLFLYPLANKYENKVEVEKTKKNFENTVEKLHEESNDEENPLNRLYSDMKAYNEKIYKDNQSDLKDPWSYQQSSFDLTQYGVEDNIIGYITVPHMEIELPIYLGANTDNMAKGAVHMSQTSLPIGGENTNCVIAAHRGYKGIPMFCDIEIMEIGDEVIIKNLWETLRYRVSEIKVINPTDSQEVLIQPGKDMVTLITCHPYTKHYKRYVVYCEREKDNEEEVNNQTISTETATSSKEDKPKKLSESQYKILFDRYSPLAGVIIMGILLIIVIVTGKKKK
ncbi:MAG: class C sortase [Clostridium sp.]|nr:class C sortase [Clostridium sp.]